MTPQQVHIVQSTWLKVLPIKETAAQAFYDKLLEMDPSLKALFRGSMRKQGQKLMHAIDFTVNGLSRLERILPAIEALGWRHASYGVKDEHYDAVGAALLWTLGKGLGDAFTPEVKDAWTMAYGVLAATMQEATAAARV